MNQLPGVAVDAAKPGQSCGPAVEITHLRKAYGNVVAVDDVSLSVTEGEIFGILGPNGAGKTTTVECAIGLRAPDAGTIRLLGLDPQADRDEARQVTGCNCRPVRCPPGRGSARSSPCTGRSTGTRPTWAS
jgi:ABC-type glutathione transport system ATPase component